MDDSRTDGRGGAWQAGMQYMEVDESRVFLYFSQICKNARPQVVSFLLFPENNASHLMVPLTLNQVGTATIPRASQTPETEVALLDFTISVM